MQIQTVRLIYELAHNKCFKKKSRKQFNFIHNNFKFLTLLQIFGFKIFGLTQGIYFFLFYQVFFQKKMNQKLITPKRTLERREALYTSFLFKYGAKEAENEDDC